MAEPRPRASETRFQSEAGLHQNWMRDYDHTTGRYVQADPLGLVDGASIYGYALQNPGLYSDPTGECVGPWAIACAAAATAAVNVAVGILIDEILGDGCYTWREFGQGAALGAMFGGLGAAWGLAGNGWKYGAIAGAATKVSPAAMHGHHPIPKVLGGNANQSLVPLPQKLHTGAGTGFHQQLSKRLKSEFGHGTYGSKGSTQAWDRYFRANPGAQQKAFDILLETSQAFDAQHGTKNYTGCMEFDGYWRI